MYEEDKKEGEKGARGLETRLTIDSVDTGQLTDELRDHAHGYTMAHVLADAFLDQSLDERRSGRMSSGSL